MRLKCSIAAVVALCVCAGSVAFGQIIAGEKGDRKRIEKQQRQTVKQGVAASGQVEAFAKQLGLTDDQKNKVQIVVTGYRKGVRDIQSDTSVKAEDKKAKVDALRTKSDLEIRAILTAQQSEQAQKDNMIQKLLSVGSARPSLNEMADALKLTDDQRQKIAAVYKESRARQDEIAQNANLTPDAKREQYKALNKDRQKKILALLTDEQKARYLEMTASSDQGRAKANKELKNRPNKRDKNAKRAEKAGQIQPAAQ